MSSLAFTQPPTGSATRQLSPHLVTLSLDGDAWLAAHLAGVLGPLALRTTAPPAPARPSELLPPWLAVAHAQTTRGARPLDGMRPLLICAALALLVGVLALFLGTRPTPPAWRMAPAVPLAPTAPRALLPPTSLPPVAPTATATALPATALPATALPVPATATRPAPTHAPAVPPTAPRRATAVPAHPTSRPVVPTATPWWPNLVGSPTPVRGPITPTPGSGVAGNDWCQSCFLRSAGVPAPTP